jgi:hypothetical protein
MYAKGNKVPMRAGHRDSQYSAPAYPHPRSTADPRTLHRRATD